MNFTPIRCAVCREDANEDDCLHDPSMGGMVCPDCRRLLIQSQAWLKHCGLPRPIQPSDINQHNFKRFETGYHETSM